MWKNPWPFSGIWCSGRFFPEEFSQEQKSVRIELITRSESVRSVSLAPWSPSPSTPEALTEVLNVNVSYVRRFLRLTLLAPPIVEAIFEGRAPWSPSLTKLDTNLPYSWKEQMKLFDME